MGARLSAGGAGAVVVLALLGLTAAGCGAASEPVSSASGRVSSASESVSSSAIPRSLLLGARPIGRGPRFHPPAGGPVIGPCMRRLGPREEVHVELFAANRVVLVPAGIGTRPPLRFFSGRIAGAGCYGALVTIDPTGLLLVSRARRLTLSDLFRSWGQPLTRRRLGAFPASRGSRVEVFVGGRRWRAPPGSVPLTEHSEIVLEVGPHVPPHTGYTFPPLS